MNRTHDFVRLGILVLSAVPTTALATETPITSPPNMAIICVPGYNNNVKKQEVDNNSPGGTQNNANLFPFSPENLFKHPFFIRDYTQATSNDQALPDIKQKEDGSITPVESNVVPENKAFDMSFIIKVVATASGIMIHDINNQVTIIKASANNMVETVLKSIAEIEATYANTWEYISNYTEQSFNDLARMGAAIEHFVTDASRNQLETLQNSAEQLKQGIIIDVLRPSGISPIQAIKNSFFEDTLNNMFLDMATSYAATFYGGPAGPTTFAAWKTIQRANDTNLVIRMGLFAATQLKGGVLVVGGVIGANGDVNKKAVNDGTESGISIVTDGLDKTANTDASDMF